MPDDDPLQAFATRLRAVRKAKGLTQERLAEEAGLHFSDVSRIERGIRDPGVRTVAKLAKGLGVPAATLFGTDSPTR